MFQPLMLDVRLLRTEPQLLRQNLEQRGVALFDDIPVGSDDWSTKTIDRIVALDTEYRDLLLAQEKLRQRQNENADAMKSVGKLPKAEQAAARGPLVEEGRAMREQERELKVAAERALLARDEAWIRMPNLTHPDAPRGMTDDD